MKFKKLFGFSILFASLVKLLFYTKTLKLHKNAPKYTPQKSDREYVEINNTNKDPDFRHPTTKMNPPHGRFENDDNVVRSPDGSA